MQFSLQQSPTKQIQVKQAASKQTLPVTVASHLTAQNQLELYNQAELQSQNSDGPGSLNPKRQFTQSLLGWCSFPLKHCSQWLMALCWDKDSQEKKKKTTQPVENSGSSSQQPRLRESTNAEGLKLLRTQEGRLLATRQVL